MHDNVLYRAFINLKKQPTTVFRGRRAPGEDSRLDHDQSEIVNLDV